MSMPTWMPPIPPAPPRGRNGRWEKIGRVGVDSASIGITDLLVRTDDSRFCTADKDPNARYATPGSEWAGDWGTGIRFWAGFGDGSYDVWAWIADYGEGDEVDERIAQVVVTMIEEDDLKNWRSMS